MLLVGWLSFLALGVGSAHAAVSQTIYAWFDVDGNLNFRYVDNSNVGSTVPPGTYQIVETLPGGYQVSATTVGTVNGTAVGSVVTAGTIGSIVETSGQAGINYNFANVQPVTLAGLVFLLAPAYAVPPPTNVIYETSTTG